MTCGLTAKMTVRAHPVGDVFESRRDVNAGLAVKFLRGRFFRFDDHDLVGEAPFQPARQQGAAHLAAADKDQIRSAHASPIGWIMAAATAFAGGLPPHSACWNAG